MPDSDAKIFNIGLPKTGTSSLHRALTLLGYRSLHNPLDFRLLSYQCGVYKYPRNDWDALTNFGEHFYPQLDAAYPGSKFILTVRSKDTWLVSAEKWFSRPPANLWIDNQGRLENFGCTTFQRARFSYVYDLHLANVEAYFDGRRGDLLTLDCASADAWQCLCRFLDQPVPDGPFPHVVVSPRSARSLRSVRTWLRSRLNRLGIPSNGR